MRGRSGCHNRNLLIRPGYRRNPVTEKDGSDVVEQVDRDVYKPSPEVVASALIKNRDEVAAMADKRLSRLWEERAQEYEWFEPWDKVRPTRFQQAVLSGLPAQRPIFSTTAWTGAQKPSRQAGSDIGAKAAKYAPSPTTRVNREVCMFGNVLRSMGVKKGDRITRYGAGSRAAHGHACAKIGAVHSARRLSVEAIHGRLEDSQSKVVITCDGGVYERKNRGAEEADGRSVAAERLIVVKRTGQGADEIRAGLLVPRFDGPADRPRQLGRIPAATPKMDAEDPLLLLPRNHRQAQAMHTHTGYMVGDAEMGF